LNDLYLGYKSNKVSPVFISNNESGSIWTKSTVHSPRSQQSFSEDTDYKYQSVINESKECSINDLNDENDNRSNNNSASRFVCHFHNQPITSKHKVNNKFYCKLC